MTTRIAVIGGSGLYEMDGVKLVDHVAVATPFGDPSDRIGIAEIGGEKVAFLPRHGRGHRLLPSEVPSRANIWALKSLGVAQIVSIRISTWSAKVSLIFWLSFPRQIIALTFDFTNGTSEE